MWIDRLTNNRTAAALELTAQFAEQRQRLLAESLANVDTPGHVSRRLDPGTFQATLRQALDGAKAAGTERLDLRGAQAATGTDGRLVTRPITEPAENVLFHDGTNVRLERLVTDANSNALLHETATGLLRSRYDLLLRAIRGRVT